MYRLLIILFLLFANVTGYTQNAEVQKIQETARAFMRQSDFQNALLVLNRGLANYPDNIELTKDLALTYLMQKNVQKALETIKPTLDRPDVDDQCYQIAGSIYKEKSDLKEGEKLYKKGIKRFPESGPLYNEYGEFLMAQNDPTAIKQWEAGIENDPGYSRNYYNAARFYNRTADKTWTIIYGEIFANMEPTGRFTPEMKDILFTAYKSLFEQENLENYSKSDNAFLKKYLQTMNKQSSVALKGINTQTLTMIRTRFILDWYTANADIYPFKLFEYHQQLLQEGLFEAYDQWLFGSSENLSKFQNWTSLHKEEYNAFLNFQRSKMFKVNKGQL